MKESFEDLNVRSMDDPKKEGSGQTLESLGAILREEREAQGFTLSYLADKTKIRQAYLEVIESGTMEGFYGTVYKRGFVKCYLDTLGRLDLWPAYDRLLKDEKRRVEPLSTPPLGEFTPPAKGFRKGSRRSIFVLLVAVIFAAGWYVWSNREILHDEVARIQQEQLEIAQKAKEDKEKEDEEAKLAAEAAQKEAALNSAASGDESSDVPLPLILAPVSGETDKPVLSISALKDSWIRITKEGERIFGGTLKSGQDAQIAATGRIHVIYGRPETLKVRWNGKDSDPAKEGAGPIHFLYSPDGSSRVVSPQDAEKLWIEAVSVDEEAPQPKQAEVASGPSVLVIKAVKGDCWLKATSGGKTFYSGTMRKGGETSIELKEDVRVVFGNPSALSITVDGKDVGYVGNPGRISRTIYSPDGSKKEAPKE